VAWETPQGDQDTLQFMAVDIEAYTQVTNFVFSGEQVKPERALEKVRNEQSVFVSSVLAEKYGFSPGKTIRLKTNRGWKDFDIAGVVVDFYNQGLVVQGGWDTMRRYFDILDANTLMVKTLPGSSIGTVQDLIERLYGQRFNLTLESNDSVRTQALNLMEQAFRMFDVMALISIVVGSLGVVNTLTMSVIERRREIGMLRAIGTTRGQIVRMVMAESGLIGVIGGILGIATGVILARILFIGMTTMSGYQLTFQLPPVSVLVSLVMAIVISQIAALPPARRASRVKILEAVQYE
jgi:putative ABC transport system permease protein